MISVEHLTKYYGEHLAVDDLSFEIADGHVYGFLGPNGAGKSTTMNIMTGCLSATDGHILIEGHDIFDEPQEAKRLIGYLPEQSPLYMNETPLDYLMFVGRAKGLKGEALYEQIENVIEQTGISQVAQRRISQLSKGYKQRVGIAQALLGNPKVIILDEPTVGLDPLQIIEIRELIRSLGETHTVIFSSHILSEVQAICDQILMIAGGKLVAFGTPEELEKKLLSPNEIMITIDAEKEYAESLLTQLPHITEITAEEDHEGHLHVNVKSDIDDIYELSRMIFRTLAAKGIDLLEMNLKKADLEDIFIELTDSRYQADAEADGALGDEDADVSENAETYTDMGILVSAESIADEAELFDSGASVNANVPMKENSDREEGPV